MRLGVVLALLAMFAAPASPQETRPLRQMPPLQIRIASIEQLQSTSETLAAKLELDAFVSTRLAAAVADLEDFRTSAALAKARGRVEEARLRVSQTREADPRIPQILKDAREILDQAERNSGAIDLGGTRRDLLRQSGHLQRVLYDDLDAAQRVRRSLSEMQKKVNMMAEGLDLALEQALSAMFSFLRSGGE